MKKTLLLSACLSLVLAAPSLAASPKPDEKLADNQTINYWLLDANKTKDPQKNSDVEGSHIARQLFEGLFNQSYEGELVPGAALSYDVSDDKTVYTFHLRPEAKWSNGDPVTADDFVYAWQRLADPATGSTYAWYEELMNVKNSSEVIAGEMEPSELGVKAVDEHTFEVTLNSPIPYFIKMTTHTSTFPVNKKVVEQYGDEWTLPGNLVGNGAYKLVDDKLGQDITLERNENYWGNDDTVIDTIHFQAVNDKNQALTRYLAGEFDYIELPAGQFPRLKEEYPDQAHAVPRSCTYAFLFNLSDKGPEALKDVRVRKALSYAMNRDVVVNNITRGGQKPAYSWTYYATADFTPPVTDYSQWTQDERNEKAKELLAEAGYGPDNPLNLTLSYNTSDDHKKIAIAAQQFWKAIGVNVTLNNTEWKVYLDDLKNHNFDIGRYAWCGDYDEASTYLDYFRSGGMNYGGFTDPDYDAMMKASLTAENPAADYDKAEQILAEQMPLVPIYFYSTPVMVPEDVKGLPVENVLQNWYGKDLYRVAE
ncbi:peptide ABC transporter substrate-binding protein [Martelella endophytica]|uniref:Peptide ABC transporter substrate-binding protein n=1 Tax=Martelella endophytica TaxID=1486262 RepID=A0A0D5LQ92_MAREN|nr:peptide ABC transporter substrate-binding protein [Martelella endophytica]AJY46316.1 peptide ABC transporter substrate-binding protein [Martelella endophytica]